MRRTTLGIVAVVAIIGAIRGDIAASPDDSTRSAQGIQIRGKMEGTWQHTFPGQPEILQTKVINQDHFIWVTYVRETGMPLALAGGSYKIDGKTYKEQIEFGQFGTEDLQKTLGKEQTFNVEIEGDKLTMSGTLSNGMKLLEHWTRVK